MENSRTFYFASIAKTQFINLVFIFPLINWRRTKNLDNFEEIYEQYKNKKH